MDGLCNNFYFIQVTKSKSDRNLFKQNIYEVEQYPNITNTKFYKKITFDNSQCLPIDIFLFGLKSKCLQVYDGQLVLIAKQILQHFNELKAKKVYHGNLKVENIVIQLTKQSNKFSTQAKIINIEKVYFTNYDLQQVNAQQMNDEVNLKQIIIELLKQSVDGKNQNIFDINYLEKKTFNDLKNYIEILYKQINMEKQQLIQNERILDNQSKRNKISSQFSQDLKNLCEESQKIYDQTILNFSTQNLKQMEIEDDKDYGKILQMQIIIQFNKLILTLKQFYMNQHLKICIKQILKEYCKQIDKNFGQGLEILEETQNQNLTDSSNTNKIELKSFNSQQIIDQGLINLELVFNILNQSLIINNISEKINKFKIEINKNSQFQIELNPKIILKNFHFQMINYFLDNNLTIKELASKNLPKQYENLLIQILNQLADAENKINQIEAEMILY